MSGSLRRRASAPASGSHLRVWLGVLALVAIFLIVDPQWTVQSIQPAGAGSAVASSTSLDPTAYVDKYWASEIVPTVRRTAVAFPKLMADLRRDPTGTANEYGHTAELGGQPTFSVKGTAKVLSVNTSGIPAEAALAFGSSAKATADMQLGPILTGTDVRDAMRFINFNQFADQVTYSEVATAINLKIDKTTLSGVDNAKLAGRTITFFGAFTYTPGQTPLITPVIVETQH